MHIPRSRTRSPHSAQQPGSLFRQAIWILLLAALGPAMASAAGLLVAEGGFGGVLEIEEHDVQVTINNGVAVTTVEQVFRNLEDRQVEALYTFPVPKGASVANFSMWIGGKEMVGEVLEKERARQIYDSYKRQRRDPGLLEQVDFKTFEMRIFPIAARAEQRIEITYYQELQVDDHWATYVYPLATVAHEGRGSATRGSFAVNFEVLSEIPIAEMMSPSHGGDFVVAEHDPSLWQASLETQGGDLNRDVVLAYRLARPVTGINLVASRANPQEDGFFLLTLTTGENLDAKVERGSDYVFVLDISGSMDNDGKLALSRRSLGAFIDVLAAEDRFEVITFNVSANALFGDLRPGDARSKQLANEFLDSQKARGGTMLEPAIRGAYNYKAADRPLNVVILSDGMTEAGERATLLALAAERPAGSRLFTIGVGNEVNRPLLEQLAEDAGGLAAFVSRGADFARQAQAFRRKLMRPVATNVSIDLEGAEVSGLAPEGLPNLYHGVPLRLYGRYRKAGPVRVRLAAAIGGEEFEQVVEFDLPQRADNPEIERMWAFERIDDLLAEGDRRGSRRSVIDEVVRLGEAFSIVTEYTSFIVLENDAEYQRWKIERRNVLRLARDRSRQAEVRQRIETLRRGVSADLGPVRPGTKAKTAPQLAAANKPLPTPSAGGPASNRPTRRNRGDLPSFGGGAFDSLTALVVLAMGMLFWWGRRWN